MSMSRRELFGFLRRPADSGSSSDPAALDARAPANKPEQPAFSLDSFYRDRHTVGSLPEFAIRTGKSSPTTNVGVGLTSRPSAVASETIAPVPSGMVPSVLTGACLATQTFCSVCSERCPSPGAIAVSNGRPQIVPEACTGCGKCIAVCPAPVLALTLVTRSSPPPNSP